MNRRDFLLTGAAAAATVTLPSSAQTATATLEIDTTNPGPRIPADFTGLSYESAQLANPDFFSAKSEPLIRLFRELSPTGNLRLGGGSSEYTTYSDADPTGQPPFEVFGPDTSKTVKHGTTTTALALRNLRAFLDATGWTCLYGLNLGQGTKENAAAEADAAFRILGPKLVAFQIGNEPDSFRNRFRPATYAPADFIAEWNTFHDAIVSRAPHAKFAGPDISNKLPFLTAFAQEARRHPDVVLLTGHYYAMGPARSPDATIDQLAEPEPKLATMHQNGFEAVAEAMKLSGLPYRMSEGNSCWDGGKPGVSDTLASALWCADTMLRFASLGWCGVNLHGGGNGFYTPIAGLPSTGFTRRPEYFGIQFAQTFAGATLLSTQLKGTPNHITAYAAEQAGKHQVALINKAAAAVRIKLPERWGSRAMQLTGPALDAKEGTTLAEIHVRRSRAVEVPALTATILEF